MRVGDLVQNKRHPERIWLVVKIDSTRDWFMAHDYGLAWLSIGEYKVISAGRTKK